VETILDSTRVVEMTEALAGPYWAMLLGDFSADVIKVEQPGAGDQSRGWGSPFVGSESAYYFAANRNKRSIILNYDDPRGAEALQELRASADVFIINQPSLASLQKRGIDPDSLRELSATHLLRHPPVWTCRSEGGHAGELSLAAAAAR
jgi:crotonobetainyl-CoA:carnitine CoA-transferase CaiB-like acyl-CoA transferase